MCGIYGWIGSIKQGSHESVADALKHRGPDATGSFSKEEYHLGMTRLAILDLEAAPQPYFNADQSIASVCNGEIYNWKDLRAELEEKGHCFHTQCDAEIIPFAWQEWGEQMLEKFNGMFAIALWDQSKDGIFLARDRCGQKPLYFAKNIHHAWSFASEPVGLFSLEVERAFEPDALAEYLALRYVSEPRTLFKNVFQVRSGHCGWLTKSGFAEKQWWQLPEQTNEATSIEALEKQTRNSIAAALESDVPIAVYLSAGVDSSVLLSMINEANCDVTAITAGFQDSVDEVAAASELAKSLGVKHLVANSSTHDLLRLPEVVKQMQVPVGDALILAFDKLAETSARHGCKVAMGGEGIDELFDGYSFLQLSQKVDKMPQILRKLVAKMLALTPSTLLDKFSTFPANLGESGKMKIVRWLDNYEQLNQNLKGIGLRTLFDSTELDQLLLKPSTYSATLPAANNLAESHTKAQFQGWLPDWSIIRQDRNAMAHSVEYRMPFLDHQLIEHAQKTSLSNKKNKRCWRNMAAKYAPKVQSKTTKIPFYFPIESFVQNPELWLLIEDCLSEKSVQKRQLFQPAFIRNLLTEAKTGEFLPIKQVMSLVILELWIREFIDTPNCQVESLVNGKTY